jgi:hypothetical protein
MKDRFEQGGLSNFIAVLHAFDSINMKFDRLLVQLDSVTYHQSMISSESVDSMVSRSFYAITTDYKNLVLELGERSILDQQDVELHTTRFQANNDTLIQKWKDLEQALTDPSLLVYALPSLAWDIKQRQFNVLRDINIYFLGCSRIIFNEFFPIVNARHGAVKTNQAFEAELSIGTYSSQINPKNITMVVNGDTLGVDDEGKAMLVIPPTYRTGQQVLKLEAFVTNPLTGEVSTGQSIFEYQVIP